MKMWNLVVLFDIYSAAGAIFSHFNCLMGNFFLTRKILGGTCAPTPTPPPKSASEGVDFFLPSYCYVIFKIKIYGCLGDFDMQYDKSKHTKVARKRESA